MRRRSRCELPTPTTDLRLARASLGNRLTKTCGGTPYSRIYLRDRLNGAIPGPYGPGPRLVPQRVANLLPTGDEQLQFEIAAMSALALADIHGMSLDADDQ